MEFKYSFLKKCRMIEANTVITKVQNSRSFFTNYFVAPITEEGLLIGIAIVAILIILGIVFGVFEWIGTNLRSVFESWQG